MYGSVKFHKRPSTTRERRRTSTEVDTGLLEVCDLNVIAVSSVAAHGRTLSQILGDLVSPMGCSDRLGPTDRRGFTLRKSSWTDVRFGEICQVAVGGSYARLQW